jgi:hypothetical protein
MGGLGNVLFQVAVSYAVSLRDDMELLIDSNNHYGAHNGIHTYKNNILRNFNFSEKPLTLEGYGERGHHFTEIPKFESDTKLIGYFQSEKYFIDFKDKILEAFSPTIEILNNLYEKYGYILSGDVNSIHVRRGDYVGLPNHHPLTPIEYYEKSVELLGSENFYLIFSDDIKWCMENFNFVKNKIFVNNLIDYEELYLMSLCKNNIIANSTFSWWGAWMNKNEAKKVIAPKIWFGPSLYYHNTDDIYCDNWIKL